MFNLIEVKRDYLPSIVFGWPPLFILVAEEFALC